MKTWTYKELWVAGLLPHEEYENRVREYTQRVRHILWEALIGK